MAITVSKTNDLVFDGWTIPRAPAGNPAGIKRGAIKVSANDIMYALV